MKLTIPMPAGPVGDGVEIDLPAALSEEQWAYLMRVLAAMKPGLVRKNGAPQ